MESEQIDSFTFSQISKDSQLFSLFNQCEPTQDIQQLKKQVSGPQDLHPQQNYNFPGYWSEQQTIIHKKIKKSKQIINQVQKSKNKKRTKLYIQMLQSRITELENQNDKMKKLNKINKEYIYRLNENEHHVNSYFVGREQVYQKLQRLNSEQQPNNKKIVDEITSLRLRRGSWGKDRLKAINYYFKQMIQMLLPQIQKYLVKIAIEKSQFFDDHYLQTGTHINQIQGWRKDLFDGIQQEDSQTGNIKKFLKNNHQRLLGQSNKFRSLLQKLYQDKCNLIDQAKKIQEVFDGVSKYMSPKQISLTLCYIDKYRFEKDISLQQTFRSLFQQSSRETQCYDPQNPFKSSKE